MVQISPAKWTLAQTRDQLRARSLKATSSGRNWGGLAFDEFGAMQIDDRNWMPPRDHHVVTVALGASPFVHQERFGGAYDGPCAPGESIIIPEGHETRFHGLLPNHIRIAVTPETLREGSDALMRLGARPEHTITNVFRAADTFLTNIAQIYSLELSRPAHPVQDLLVESLAVALFAHLLRQYTRGAEISEKAPIARRSAVQRAMDYIQNFRHDQITLSELAEASGLSRFHLIRVFKGETGVSPMQYLEGSRIQHAQALIRQAELSLAQIAVAAGFADQSHFTRRFKAHVGFTPAQYAREYARKRAPS